MGSQVDDLRSDLIGKQRPVHGYYHDMHDPRGCSSSRSRHMLAVWLAAGCVGSLAHVRHVEHHLHISAHNQLTARNIRKSSGARSCWVSVLDIIVVQITVHTH